MPLSVDDESLLANLTQQNPQSIKSLCSAYGPEIYGFLVSLLGLRAIDAHSVLVESFASVAAEAQKGRVREALLIRLTREVLNHMRWKLWDSEGETPFEGSRQELSLVFRALSRLAWEERILLLLRDQMDFTYEEMASVLSLSVEAVKTRLAESKKNFRHHINEIMK